MTSVLKTSFPGAVISVQTDILGAARACCGEKEGIVCILGTGSNSCFYTGKKIGFKTPSLGYILGDEGGGTFLGKKVLQYYLHGIFDSTLMKAFEKEFPLNKEEILDQIYRQPFPNRSLATYATFVLRHRGHYMIENIAEDALNEFFLHHILRYPKVHQRKVHFTGSVAAGLKDILQILCEQYEIPFGQVIQKPIEGLARYHKQVE